MPDFSINTLLSNPGLFLLFLAAFTLLFHWVLVFRGNLSKRNWKRIDYIWVSAGILGLLSLVGDMRMSIAESSHETATQKAIGMWTFLKNYQFEDKIHTECVLVTEHKDSACDWFVEFRIYIDGFTQANFGAEPVMYIPPIDPNFSDLINIPTEFIVSIREFNRQLEIVVSAESLTSRSALEELLALATPFLLCFAIALRLTKVTGEVRHEKGEVD